jgi:soluble cytochrome b562
MAIKVNARAIKQNTADASVFGYNTVYQSAAPAVAQALSQTANSIASASAKIKRRKQENDLFTAQESFGEYQRGLNEAAVQLDTAYASQDEERIKQAEANFNSFNAEAEFFTVGTYGKEVDDPRVFRRFNEDAKNAWAKQSLATANVKEHRRSIGFLKDDHRNAEESTFNLVNGLEGKRMTLPTLRNQAAYLNMLYNRGYLNTLPSEGARTAAIGNLNDKVEFLFESAARSGAGDPEYVAQVKQMFTDLRADGFFEGFARSEELMKSADTITAQIAKASAEERAAILKTGIEDATTSFFNIVSQDDYSFLKLRNAGASFLSATAGIDSESLDVGSKERRELESTRAAAEFYSKPIYDDGTTAADLVLRSAFQRAQETGTPIEDNIVIPEQYSALLARTRDFTGIRTNLRKSAQFLREQITTGNPRVLNNFGVQGEFAQRQFLDRHGYEYVSLFVRMEAYLTEVFQYNRNGATLMMEGHNLLKNKGSETDKLHGVMLQHVAMAGSPEAAKTLGTLYTKYYNLRDHRVTQTKVFKNRKAIVVREEGELYQLRLQALKNGETDLANVYNSIIDGMVAHMTLQPLSDSEDKNVVDALQGMAGGYPKDLRREFNALEFQFVANNIGIARRSEATGGHQVRVHQSLINLLDLGEKDPFMFGDAVLSPLEGTLPYQAIKSMGQAAFNEGVYTMIPDFFVRELVYGYTEELANSYELLFRPEILGKLGDDFKLIVDEYQKGAFPKEELADRLIEADVEVAGAGTGVFKEKPLLDFSSFGKLADGSNQMGVSVRYYDRVSGRYRQLHDALGNPVVLNIQKIKNRIAPTGKLVMPVMPEPRFGLTGPIPFPEAEAARRLQGGVDILSNN